MSNVNGINPAAGPAPIQPPSPAKAAAKAASPPPADRVEISMEAQIAGKIADLPPTRTELIARAKAEIKAGTCDTPEKLDKALDALMDELGLV